MKEGKRKDPTIFSPKIGRERHHALRPEALASTIPLSQRSAGGQLLHPVYSSNKATRCAPLLTWHCAALASGAGHYKH